MTNKAKQKLRRMNFLTQPRVRVIAQTIEKKDVKYLKETILMIFIILKEYQIMMKATIQYIIEHQ